MIGWRIRMQPAYVLSSVAVSLVVLFSIVFFEPSFRCFLPAVMQVYNYRFYLQGNQPLTVLVVSSNMRQALALIE